MVFFVIVCSTPEFRKQQFTAHFQCQQDQHDNDGGADNLARVFDGETRSNIVPRNGEHRRDEADPEEYVSAGQLGHKAPDIAGEVDNFHAAGGVKIINLSSNIGSLVTQLTSGYVFLRVGLIAAVFSIAGHYIGAGLAIKNASKIVRPAVIVVLILLTLKVGSELLFPEFWS